MSTLIHHILGPVAPEFGVYCAGMDLVGQKGLVLQWLESPDARTATTSVLRKWSSVPFGVDDLIQDAWIRLSAAFDRREGPYPDLVDEVSIRRFCIRVIDNLARDRMRSARRRGEVSITLADPPFIEGEFQTVEQRAILTKTIEVIGSTGVSRTNCPGCPSEVVVASALEVIHLVLVGREDDGVGRSWMDRLLHSALDRVVDPQGLSYEARNQRKSRCGRCVVALLTQTLETVMEDGYE